MSKVRKVKVLFTRKSFKKAYNYMKYRDGKNLVSRFISGFNYFFSPTINSFSLKSLAAEMARFHSESSKMVRDNCSDILVIVPVYNSPDITRECLEAILIAEPTIQVLAVDDCSPDAAIVPILQELATNNPERFRWIQTPRNLGFPGAANLGISQRGDNHALLVNSDVIVSKGFASSMKIGLTARQKVASVTCLTNAGESASIPTLGENTQLPEREMISEINMLAQQRENFNSPKTWPVLPSGVGFCMLLSSQALKKIGVFNEKEFSPGYGEENDWSLRASESGFVNLLCPNVYVYHVHGLTYGTSKQALIEQHLAIINKRYPYYEQSVRKYFAEDTIAYYRHALFFQAISQSPSFKTIVIVDHQRGGGAVKTLNEEIETLQNALVVMITRISKTEVTCTFKFRNLSAINYKGNLEDLVKILRSLKVQKIILNTLALMGEDEIDDPKKFVFTLLEEFEVEREFRLHDYHSVCPSLNLLNTRGQFCGIPDLDVCDTCLPKNSNSVENKKIRVGTWRKEWAQILDKCTSIVCYSKESATRLISVYPFVESKIEIRKHLVTPIDLPIPRSNRPPILSELRIGVVGNLNLAKGSQIVIDLARAIKDMKQSSVIFSFGSIARVPNNLPISGQGPYTYPLDLYIKFKNFDLDVILMPSIWPETYNLVSDELENLRLPIVAFSLGGPFERHANKPQFYFTNIIEGPALLSFIQQAVNDFYLT